MGTMEFFTLLKSHFTHVETTLLSEFLLKTMFRFGTIFLASVYALMLKISGFISTYFYRSKSSFAEENDANFSANRSPKDDQVVSKNNSNLFLSAEKELQESTKGFNGNIVDTEGSVFLQGGLIPNSSKCQFMSGENVSRYLEEPKTVKFVVREMFVGSNDVLVSSDQSPEYGISQGKDSLELELEENVQEFCEEPDSSSFCFKLLDNIVQEKADSPEEKEKLINSADSKDFQLEELKDESLEDQDFSYEVELLPARPGQFSTPDAAQEPESTGNGIEIESTEINDSKNWMSNFLDQNDQSKLEDQRVEDLDDEYIELEPLSHIDKDSVSSGDANKADELLHEEDNIMQTSVDASQEPKSSWGSDSDNDEDEPDVLVEHQHLVQQMKMELKNCRIRSLPTISEDEYETPKMLEDFKPLEIDQKIDHKDIMEEIQKFFKSYTEKMRKLDILNYQTLHAISFLRLKDSEVFTTGKKKADSAPFILPKIWTCKGQRIYADPMHKSIIEMHRDLEQVYVGQLCLSWEILSWLYVKAQELLEYEPNGNHSYNRAAEEFQQFEVLLQRFIEDEPFQGPRIQNYVKSRCIIRSLLQVPTIKDDCLKAKKERREETDAISLEVLVEIIRESVLVFREFLLADKRTTNVALKRIQEPENSELLADIITNLQKKERRIKEQIRSQNCIVKKLKKPQESLDRELLTSQVELRLVSRVLSLSKLTTDQLVWCQKKLNNISVVSRKLHVEPSFLLFPC